MREAFQAKKISENVYWVGAIDWLLRDFHGYATHRGSSYNAFLITGEKNILIDAVKKEFKDEMLTRISSVIDPERIDYIVSNHAEMDHSGTIPDLVRELKPDRIFASAGGAKALQEHFGVLDGVEIVKNGEKRNLGNSNLQFIDTRMLHWPDSMFTYYEEEKILFSQDAFGMHLASSERFDDELDRGILEFEGGKYYANILLPYSALVLKLITTLSSSGLQINMVAPDHGPVWRKHISWILDLYAKWAHQKPEKKAVVVYDTMWGSTHKMAEAIVEGLADNKMDAKLMMMGKSHRSDVATELLDAGALIVGSPTLNNNIFPTIADVMTYLSGLKPKNKIGAVFGSYGWSGEATKHLRERLTGMKIEVMSEDLKTKYIPDKEFLTKCYYLGVEISEQLGKTTGR